MTAETLVAIGAAIVVLLIIAGGLWSFGWLRGYEVARRETWAQAYAAGERSGRAQVAATVLTTVQHRPKLDPVTADHIWHAVEERMHGRGRVR